MLRQVSHLSSARRCVCVLVGLQGACFYFVFAMFTSLVFMPLILITPYRQVFYFNSLKFSKLSTLSNTIRHKSYNYANYGQLDACLSKLLSYNVWCINLYTKSLVKLNKFLLTSKSKEKHITANIDFDTPVVHVSMI